MQRNHIHRSVVPKPCTGNDAIGPGRAPSGPDLCSYVLARCQHGRARRFRFVLEEQRVLVRPASTSLGQELLAGASLGRRVAVRVPLILIALTAPVAPACRVTPSQHLRDASWQVAIDDEDLLGELLVKEQLIQLLANGATLRFVFMRRHRDAVGLFDRHDHDQIQQSHCLSCSLDPPLDVVPAHWQICHEVRRAAVKEHSLSDPLQLDD